MRLHRILLAGVAVVSMHAVPASSQNVVMRRPLPNKSAPTTPTGPTTPTQTVTAQGWKVNCTANDMQCFTVTQDTNGDITTAQVDDAACGTTQSAAQQTLAHSAGLKGLGEGFDSTHGLESCGTTPPTSTLGANGWSVDCVAKTTTCKSVTKAANGTFTTASVDDAQCAGTQTAAQQKLAHDAGLTGLGEGVSAGYVPTACGPTRPTDPPSETGYGWLYDCEAKTAQCWRMETVDSGFGYNYVNQVPVDATECPATQPAAAQALAHNNSLFGMGEGIDATHGHEMCNKTDPRYVEYAVGYCSSGVTTAQCTRAVMADPDDGGPPLTTLSLGSTPEAMAKCGQQAESPAWDRAIASSYLSEYSATNQFGFVRPADAAAFSGKSCGPPPKVTYGKICTGDQVSQCKKVSYKQSGFSPVNIVSVEDAPSDSCDNAQTTFQDENAVSRAGLLSPTTPDSTCEAPLYASQGQCKFSITYDPGWPNSGQSHVDYDFIEKCFAISGVDNPDGVTANPTDLANCQNQEPTQTQLQKFAQIEPAFHNPKTLDRTCDVTFAVHNADYLYDQKDTVSGRSLIQITTNSGTGQYVQEQVEQKIDYVCTDDAYWYTQRSAFASRFSTTEVPRCFAAHLQQMNDLQNGDYLSGTHSCGSNDEGNAVCDRIRPTLTVTDDAVNEVITVRFTNVYRQYPNETVP